MSSKVDDAPRFSRLKPGPSAPPAEVAASQQQRLQAATIQVVASGGYEAVNVRDIVRLAKVSTRSFYEHFDSKEECVVRAYADVVHDARIGLIAAQMEGGDWSERLRRILVSFAQAVTDNPAAARLVLVDAYADGSAALDRAHTTEANFVSMLAKGISRPPGGVVVSHLVVEGMMAGVLHVARTRLLAGGDLADAEGELMDWAGCFPGDASVALARMDSRDVRGSAALLEMRERESRAASPGDDRAAIIAAVSKLCAAGDFEYANLRVPVIRAAAGVSRRVFDAHFGGVEDCVLAALDQKVSMALADAATEQMAGSTWEGGVYRAISSLCGEIAGDALLARIASRGVFPRGSKGYRVRLDLATTAVEQIRAGAGAEYRCELAAEASAGAVWMLFHHHALRSWNGRRPEISATLAYMALAPLVGGPAAIAAIRAEQVA